MHVNFQFLTESIPGIELNFEVLIHPIELYIISKLMQSHIIKRVKVIKWENFPILGPNRKIYRLL